MKKTKKANKAQLVVEAKAATKENQARIVIKSTGHYKSIPVVFFTEKETQSLLEIVDKVERANAEKFLYK